MYLNFDTRSIHIIFASAYCYDFFLNPFSNCIASDCGTPFVYHGFLTGTMETVYDGTSTIACDPGYESGGTATCLDTGLWDEVSMPTCDPVGKCQGPK